MTIRCLLLAPNNSFKPTPCRGVGHVLYATLAHVRRPATGRLNSGVRPRVKISMLYLFLTFAIALIAVGINSCAVYAGSSIASWRHRSAMIFGIAGLFFIIFVPISLLYTLGNYFLEPASDTSLLFLTAIGGAIICTFASLFFCFVIWRHDARSVA
jgi:hypothetical protein